MEENQIDEITKEAESLWDNSPKGGIPYKEAQDKHLLDGKKLKKEYVYGYQEIRVEVYTDNSALVTYVPSMMIFYFPKANDGFQWAKPMGQRCKMLNGLMG